MANPMVFTAKMTLDKSNPAEMKLSSKVMEETLKEEHVVEHLARRTMAGGIIANVPKVEIPQDLPVDKIAFFVKSTKIRHSVLVAELIIAESPEGQVLSKALEAGCTFSLAPVGMSQVDYGKNEIVYMKLIRFDVIQNGEPPSKSGQRAITS